MTPLIKERDSTSLITLLAEFHNPMNVFQHLLTHDASLSPTHGSTSILNRHEVRAAPTTDIPITAIPAKEVLEPVRESTRIPDPRASIRGLASDEALFGRNGTGSNEGQAGSFELSLAEDVDVSGDSGGRGGVISCEFFGAAGDTIGKAVGRRAVGESGDDSED